MGQYLEQVKHSSRSPRLVHGVFDEITQSGLRRLDIVLCVHMARIAEYPLPGCRPRVDPSLCDVLLLVLCGCLACADVPVVARLLLVAYVVLSCCMCLMDRFVSIFELNKEFDGAFNIYVEVVLMTCKFRCFILFIGSILSSTRLTSPNSWSWFLVALQTFAEDSYYNTGNFPCRSKNELISSPLIQKCITHARATDLRGLFGRMPLCRESLRESLLQSGLRGDDLRDAPYVALRDEPVERRCITHLEKTLCVSLFSWLILCRKPNHKD